MPPYKPLQTLLTPLATFLGNGSESWEGLMTEVVKQRRKTKGSHWKVLVTDCLRSPPPLSKSPKGAPAGSSQAIGPTRLRNTLSRRAHPTPKCHRMHPTPPRPAQNAKACLEQLWEAPWTKGCLLSSPSGGQNPARGPKLMSPSETFSYCGWEQSSPLHLGIVARAGTLLDVAVIREVSHDYLRASFYNFVKAFLN